MTAAPEPVIDIAPYNAAEISQAILQWYDQNGRKSLPWQQPGNAYAVWLSEIMLQQTQVATVIPYFERFVQRFPNVATLAQAQPDEVLHLWTGLGYYARARNLHKCAQQIMTYHQGEFPKEPDQLAQLPGIGRSTAAAIAAQAFNRQAAILDGNVKRLLCRLHTVPGWPGHNATQKILWQLAEHYTPAERCQAYTQAVMDLGALVCTRSNPDCHQCPLATWCNAKAQGVQNQFPMSKPRKSNPTRQTKLYCLSNNQGAILLLQRPPSGIWGGLWSLPDETATEQLLGYCPDTEFSEVLEHKFSHFTLQARICRHTLSEKEIQHLESRIGETSQCWYCANEPDTIGLPAPIYKLLHQPATPELF